MQIRAKGLEKIRLCGRRRKVLREALREVARGACPEAFCIIALWGVCLLVVPVELREEGRVLVNDCD